MRWMWLLLNALIALLLAVSLLAGSIEAWIAWSLLGEEYAYIAGGILLYYLVDPLTGLYAILAVVSSGSLNLALKYSINSPRPPNPVIPENSPGFPSGHSQVTSAFWATLSLIQGNPYLTSASILLVAGVLISRLQLRAHYPVDVIGGVVLGTLVAVLITAARSRLKTLTAATGLLGIALSALTLVLNPGNKTALGVAGVSIAIASSTFFIEESIEAVRKAGLKQRLLVLSAVAAVTAILYKVAGGQEAVRVVAYALIGLVVLGAPVAYNRITGIMRGKRGVGPLGFEPRATGAQAPHPSPG